MTPVPTREHKALPTGFLKTLGFVVGGVGLAVIATFGVAALAQRPIIRRLRRLASSRDRAAAFAEFHTALPDVPEPFRIEAYGLLQGVTPLDDFPILPQDDLWQDLEIDQGNLETAFEDYFERRSWPVPQDALNGTTAADFTRMLHRGIQSNGAVR